MDELKSALQFYEGLPPKTSLAKTKLEELNKELVSVCCFCFAS